MLKRVGRAVFLTNEANARYLLDALNDGQTDGPSLRLLYRRPLPLGYMAGVAFVTQRQDAQPEAATSLCRELARADAAQPEACADEARKASKEPGARVPRFDWEPRAGRSSWEAARKEQRPALVPVGRPLSHLH